MLDTPLFTCSVRNQSVARTSCGSDRRYSRLYKACEYAEVNFDEQLTLERMAMIAGYEKSYMSRLFKNQFGVGLFEWLRELRIYHASRLLRDSTLSISEIAYSVGFSDLSTFERNFRLSQGITPRDFRRNHGLSSFTGSRTAEYFVV